MRTIIEPWSAREVGLLFAYSGLVGIIWQGGLIGRLVKRYGEVVAVSDAAKGAGVEKVGIVTPAMRGPR